jgi:hypothetical protein
VFKQRKSNNLAHMFDMCSMGVRHRDTLNVGGVHASEVSTPSVSHSWPTDLPAWDANLDHGIWLDSKSLRERVNEKVSNLVSD